MPGLYHHLPIITLTTDFGERDPYVAAMKGVILSICPRAQLIDLSHEIAPQDIFEASLFLAQAVPRFPPGTIHLVVIDPGVGSPRLPLAIRAGSHTFVCPDNGLLTHFLKELHLTAYQACTLANPRYRLKDQSTTFHGRDIFAPAAAYLARGLAFEQLGPRQEQIITLPVPAPVTDQTGTIQGEIVHIDHFGNAISNLSRTYVEAEAAARQGTYTQGRLGINGNSDARFPIVATYSSLPLRALGLLWGSSGYLEVAINQGHAAQSLGLHRSVKLYLSLD